MMKLIGHIRNLLSMNDAAIAINSGKCVYVCMYVNLEISRIKTYTLYLVDGKEVGEDE